MPFKNTLHNYIVPQGSRFVLRRVFCFFQQYLHSNHLSHFSGSVLLFFCFFFLLHLSDLLSSTEDGHTTTDMLVRPFERPSPSVGGVFVPWAFLTRFWRVSVRGHVSSYWGRRGSHCFLGVIMDHTWSYSSGSPRSGDSVWAYKPQSPWLCLLRFHFELCRAFCLATWGPNASTSTASTLPQTSILKAIILFWLFM